MTVGRRRPLLRIPRHHQCRAASIEEIWRCALQLRAAIKIENGIEERSALSGGSPVCARSISKENRPSARLLKWRGAAPPRLALIRMKRSYRRRYLSRVAWLPLNERRSRSPEGRQAAEIFLYFYRPICKYTRRAARLQSRKFSRRLMASKYQWYLQKISMA